MKSVRILCLMLLLSLVPAFAFAAEVFPAFTAEKNAVDAAQLTDGDDTTGYAFRHGKSAVVTIDIPEGSEVQCLTVRQNAAPAKAVVSKVNGKKTATIGKFADPGADCVLTLSAPVSGRIQVEFSYNGGVDPFISSLRLFSNTQIPDDIHVFRHGEKADILYIAPTTGSLNIAAVADCAAAGRSVQVAVLTPYGEGNINSLTDSLYDMGINLYPSFGTLKTMNADATAAQIEKAWTKEALVSDLTNLIRVSKPQMLVYESEGAAGELIAGALTQAAAHAVDNAFDNKRAAAAGIWKVDRIYPAGSSEVGAELADWTDEGDSVLRAYCQSLFADAEHGDPSLIPYPAARGEDGYMTEGEFLWESEENGLWVFLSPTLQIEITRYEQPDIPRVWFVSDIHFKPESESIHQQIYENASFPGQMIYPETLAQVSKLVFGINGDYYIYREPTHSTGNIIRNRQVLYNYTKGGSFPVLDTMALHDDGSMTVYNVGEITADQLMARGDVHQAMSFGPYLVRDGQLRTYDGENWNHKEPRNAIAMVEPGHYKVITVEGRFNKGVGPAGVTLNMLGELLYAEGANQAFNLDGGNTAVLIFMGHKLNRTASKSGKGTTSPRNMSELIGIGYSDLVHSERLEGK